MKIGISTATFFTKLLTENSFSVIKRCGAETCEVFLTTFFEYEESFADEILKNLDGLEVGSIHTLNTQFEPQLFNSVERTRIDAETMFKKALRVGQKIGAKYYTFHGQARLRKSTFIDPKAVGIRMRELGDIALSYGIKLCFENVHWAAFDHPEFFETVKQYAPNIGTVLDIKQAWQSGRDWTEYLAVMGDTLSLVHISDRIGDKVVMVGKGEFDFHKLASELRKIDYKGALIIEQYSSNFVEPCEVEESVKYIKNILEEKNVDQI